MTGVVKSGVRHVIRLKGRHGPVRVGCRCGWRSIARFGCRGDARSAYRDVHRSTGQVDAWLRRGMVRAA